MLDDNAEEQQMVGAQAWAQDMPATALLPEPHVSTAATDGPSVFATPSRRQTSDVTRAATVTLQASRVLRWRATIGDCCADATALRKGATACPWLLLTASCGSRRLLA